jgi:hypothetical protein
MIKPAIKGFRTVARRLHFQNDSLKVKPQEVTERLCETLETTIKILHSKTICLR